MNQNHEQNLKLDALETIVEQNGKGVTDFIYQICAEDSDRISAEEKLTDDQKTLLEQIKKIGRQVREYHPFADQYGESADVNENSKGIVKTLEAVNKALKKVVDESTPILRISSENAVKSLTEGQLKNVYEVGGSDGANDTSGRRYVDTEIFHMPSELDTSDSAIYALLTPSFEKTDGGELVSYLRNGPGNWYGRGNRDSKLGTTQVYFKLNADKIKPYSTLTVGDSFDHALTEDMANERKFAPGYKKTIVSGTSYANPEFTGAYYDVSADGQTEKGLFVDGTLGVRSITDIENSDVFTVSPMAIFDGQSSDGYPEIQIWGKDNHSTDIIDAIYIDMSGLIDPVARNDGLYENADEQTLKLIELAHEKNIPIYFLDDLDNGV